MIFTYEENKTYIEKVNKYIKIEKMDNISIKKFIDELKSLKIYEQINANGHSQQNFEIFSHLIKYAEDKHLPIKTVKFSKTKHKKARWMTNAILRSITTKDRLYKLFIQADVNNDELYKTLENEYKMYRAILYEV